MGGIKVLKATSSSGFLYMDVLVSLFVMSVFCSLLGMLMMHSIQEYSHIMEEDRTLQAMTLYMEEGKAAWVNNSSIEESPPPVGTYTFQRTIEEGSNGLHILSVVAYRHEKEVHRFTTYLLGK